MLTGKKAVPDMVFNARVSKRYNQFRLYAVGNNILNYVQDEFHPDDSAFMYALRNGSMIYGGIALTINH